MRSDSKSLFDSLHSVLTQYPMSFRGKVYQPENDERDLLMDVFNIAPELKRENRQYWGRELGMCLQRLIIEVFNAARPDDTKQGLRFGADEPCDLISADFAIDTRYRIGSGDSGTLKKFRQYGTLLKDHGYQPILLVLRNDNLPASMAAFAAGGWTATTGHATFEFIREQTGFDLATFLHQKAGAYSIDQS
jgi:hypothetical protein